MSDLVKVNKIELASELAANEVELQYEKLGKSEDDYMVIDNEGSDVYIYTKEAQDLFNTEYDKFLSIIEDCKE